jgi:hypothetical protein
LRGSSSILNLFNRKLFKRVLNISTHTLIAGLKNEDEISIIKGTIASLYSIRRNPELKRKLTEEIFKESKIGTSIYDIAIDIPHKPQFKKAGDAPINNSTIPGVTSIVTLKDVIPIEDWVKGYERFFGIIYLFGAPDRKSRVKLAIAGAKVLHGFNDGGIKYSLQIPYDAVAEDIRAEVIAETKGKGIFRI